jgi:A/G-specific adenine glycosylase
MNPILETAAGRRLFARRLLAWFDRQARDLPWRRTRDLYAIWISEIMLQQTQVATVIPYWQRFLARFPDVAALAAAEEQDVLRLWEGLGYYRRARQLHAAARQVVERHGGEFPATFDEVRCLPGIGRYTAGAILSIGLDQRLPILEANTIRLLSRLTALAGDPIGSAGQKALWATAEAILPSTRAGAFNQALMELGSEICTPKAPGCDRCPVATLCEARQKNLVDQIPPAAKKTRYEEVNEVAVVIRHQNCVLLRHCQPGERWAGLWDFPRFAMAANIADAKAAAAEIVAQTRERFGVSIVRPRILTTIKHGVTRFRITLHCYEASLAARSRQPRPPIGAEAIRWLAPDSLHEYPLSTTGRKIASWILSD